MSTLDKTLWYRPDQVIPAEHYSGYSGSIDIAPTTDITGTLQISGLGKANAVEYQVELPQDNDYTIELRYNSDSRSTLAFHLDGPELGTSDLPNSYISWRNYKVTFAMPKGRHTLRISGTEESQARINWIRITE